MAMINFFFSSMVEVWYAIAGTHKTLIFNNVTRGLGEVELGFRLVHLWEARNTSRGGMLISIEQVTMTLTNEQPLHQRPVLDGMDRASWRVLHLKEEMGLGYLVHKDDFS
ncbi:hypothetical protein YC2023_074216 [Brassica napus]